MKKMVSLAAAIVLAAGILAPSARAQDAMKALKARG